jgi:UDP-glucose 4-epimerase
LLDGGSSNFYNLGIGKGFSVKEIIDITREITGKSIKQEIVARREGDPPILYANNIKAKTELGWEPKFTRIDDIISTAWYWEQNRRY